MACRFPRPGEGLRRTRVPEDAKGRVTRSVLNCINLKSPGSNRALRSGNQLRWLHTSRE
jgi:hypothetical protein